MTSRPSTVSATHLTSLTVQTPLVRFPVRTASTNKSGSSGRLVATIKEKFDSSVLNGSPVRCLNSVSSVSSPVVRRKDPAG